MRQSKKTHKPKYWRLNSSTGKLERIDRLSSGFDLEGISFEKRPWISWLMFPMVNTLTAYVWLKKKWWNRFKGKNPPVNTMWFDGLGKYAKLVTKGHGNWESLRLIYSQPDEKHFTPSWLIDRMGFANANCQAVRNRLKTTKDISSQYITSNKNKQVLSLACGSAESIMPFIGTLKTNAHHLTLVDHDCQVGEFLENEHACSKNGCTTVVQCHTSEYLSKKENLNSYDFIEMIGALEYMDDMTATDTIRMCINALKLGGFFVTSNIRRNSESSFVKWIIDWNMAYRNLEQFALILKGGAI